MNSEIMSIAEKAGALLRDKGETVGIAESSSGGLISAHLLAIAGASSYFLGGSVIYTRHAGKGFLGSEKEKSPRFLQLLSSVFNAFRQLILLTCVWRNL